MTILPPGVYEAAEDAFEAGGLLPEGARDELEAALLAAVPLILAAERERIRQAVQAEIDRLESVELHNAAVIMRKALQLGGLEP